MPVTILKVLPDGMVRIHWEGWSDTWDEDYVDSTSPFGVERSRKITERAIQSPS